MAEVFGFILVAVGLLFVAAVVLCGLGIIGLGIYFIAASPFIIYKKHKDSQKES